MKEMYKGKVNSPATQLAEAIDLQVKNIKVKDASVLPEGPNIAVIGTDGNAETIKYESINNNILVGCTRGFQGEIRAWDKDTPIARNFTEYDLNSLQENIEDLDKNKVNTEVLKDYTKLEYNEVPVKNLPEMGNDQAGIVPAKNGKFLSIFADGLTDMTSGNVCGIEKTPFNGGRINITPIRQLPRGGATGQILKKTQNGAEWTDNLDLSNYVQKDGNKVLSSNDYTNEDKAQVASIPEYLKKKDLQGQLYDMSINRMKVEKIQYKDYSSHKISEAEAGYFEEFIRRMLEDIRWTTSNLDKLGSIIDYAGMGYKLSKNDYSNYDKAKVDAIPTNPKYTDTAALQTTTISDMNLLDEMGVYNNSFSSNCPNGATGKYTVFVLPTDASDAHRKNYLMQIAIKDNATNSPIYYRTKQGSSTWDSWHAVSRHTTEVLTESAYNNLSSKDDNTLYFIK